MYGLISKVHAVSGERDRLISILVQGVAGMPGCISYIVAKDQPDPDAIWITEVWDSEASHEAWSVKSKTHRASREAPVTARGE